MPGDADILGFWIFYLLMAALVIFGTLSWIGSVKDDTTPQIKVLQEDLSFLFKTMKFMDGNITVVYPMDDKFDVRASGDFVFISYEGIVMPISTFDSGKISVLRREGQIVIKKNE